MKNVVKVLQTTGKVNKEDLDRILADYPNRDSDGAWKAFVSAGYVTEIEIFEALAKVMNFEFIDARNIHIDGDAISSIPSSVVREERLVPLVLLEGRLLIGTDDPSNLDAIDTLAATYDYEVEICVITQSSIASILNQYFRQDAEIDDLTSQLEGVSEAVEEDSAENLASDDDGSPIVRFVNLLIGQAIRDRASDIHVEPTEFNLEVYYRIDGVRHLMQKAEKGIIRGVVSRLKVMAEIDIAERRVPQDGRLSVVQGTRRYDIRMTTLPTVWGEKIVMRILDSSSEARSVSSIQMSARNEEIFLKSLKKPHGMILVTGPTGSGKSTSLYISLEEVADPKISVVTVEDPVEKKIKGVSQMQVNNRAGMTFSRALRSILRADPDIVLIGEIRDGETAKIAIDASMTGHLVLSTLHTNGAPEAPSRMIEMGIEPYLVGSSVSCVVAQRLARRLCTDCKEEFEPEEEVLLKANYPYGGESKFYKPVGCPSCSGIGYRGRIALTEVLEMTEEIERLIISGASARVMRRHAEEAGMISLQMDGFDKVRMGDTTIEEVFRVTA